MAHTDPAIEKALAFVATSRALRERALERRKATLGRIDIRHPLPPLKKGGVQLKLKLDA